MEMEKIYEGLNEIFRDVFDDDSLTVTETTTAADIEEWDSLANINIIVSIESEFNVKFNMDEIGAMKNVGEMAKIISERMQG